MIFRILRTATDISSPMNYNYDKVENGLAEVVYVAGCGGKSRNAIRHAFEMRERGAVRTPRQISFHLSVSPGKDDDVTDEQVLEIIKEFMDRMGYGEQPWVAFRHMDTDIKHYHVLSIRIGADGKKIDTYHENYRCKDVAIELGEKYGFKLGADKEEADETINIPHYSAGQSGFKGTLDACLRHSFAYRFTTENQFREILQCHGIKMKPIVTLLAFQGTDSEGEACTPLISESDLDLDVSRALESRIENSKKAQMVPVWKSIYRNVRSSLEEASDYASFRKLLSENGIDIALTKDRSGKAIGVTMIDHVIKWAVKGSDVSRQMNTLILALANDEEVGDGQSRASEIREGSASRALLLLAAGAVGRAKPAKEKEKKDTKTKKEAVSSKRGR